MGNVAGGFTVSYSVLETYIHVNTQFKQGVAPDQSDCILEQHSQSADMNKADSDEIEDEPLSDVPYLIRACRIGSAA